MSCRFIHGLCFWIQLQLFVVCSLRAEATLPRLAELNPYVNVDVSVEPLTPDNDLSFLQKYQVKLAVGLVGREM